MKEYAVVYEWAGANYSAYVPDLPGCVACADTVEATRVLVKEAMELYIQQLKEDGRPIPEPTTKTGPIEVSV